MEPAGRAVMLSERRGQLHADVESALQLVRELGTTLSTATRTLRRSAQAADRSTWPRGLLLRAAVALQLEHDTTTLVLTVTSLARPWLRVQLQSFETVERHLARI